MLGTLAEIKALNGYHNRLNAGLVQITKLDIYEIIALENEDAFRRDNRSP